MWDGHGNYYKYLHDLIDVQSIPPPTGGVARGKTAFIRALNSNGFFIYQWIAQDRSGMEQWDFLGQGRFFWKTLLSYFMCHREILLIFKQMSVIFSSSWIKYKY